MYNVHICMVYKGLYFMNKTELLTYSIYVQCT